jgi:hypothetical protein
MPNAIGHRRGMREFPTLVRVELCSEVPIALSLPGENVQIFVSNARALARSLEHTGNVGFALSQVEEASPGEALAGRARISTREITPSVVVHEPRAEPAVRVLHKAFELDQE